MIWPMSLWASSESGLKKQREKEVMTLALKMTGTAVMMMKINLWKPFFQALLQGLIYIL